MEYKFSKIFGSIFKSFILSLSLLFILTSVNALNWHNCCDVSVNQDEFNKVYDSYLKSYCPSYDISNQEEVNKCLDVLKRNNYQFYSKFLTKDEYYKVLISDKIAECNNLTKKYKDNFLFGTKNTLFDNNYCENRKKEYGNYFFEEDVNFKDSSYEKFSVNYFKYDLENPNFATRRIEKGFRTGDPFILSNSRFNYLVPKISANEFQKIYNSAFSKAKKYCVEVKNLSEKVEEYTEYGTYLERNKEFDKCIINNIDLSGEEKDLYNYFTNDICYKGSDNYINALTICEEKLGFQNDEGLIQFPNQKGSFSCDESEMKNSCCPGYHFDNKFNICCADGFEAFKSDDGNILCGIKNGDEISKVDIKLSQNSMDIREGNYLFANLTYYYKNEEGKLIPYINKNIYSPIIVEANTNQFKFKVIKLKSKTDENGVLPIKIELNKVNIDSLGFDKNKEIKVLVYSMDMPESQRNRYFTLNFNDNLKILDIKRLSSKDEIWQGTKVKFEIEIEDQLNENKFIKVESKGNIKLGNKEGKDIVFISSKKNKIEFTIETPKVSKEIEFDYLRRSLRGIKNIGLSVGEDLLGNKYGEVVDEKKLEGFTKEFKNLDHFYKRTNLIVKTKSQTDSAVSIGRDLTKIKKEPYQYIQKGVDQLLWIEGTLGFLGEPAKPLITTFKGGLIGLQEWYKLVNDMEDVANSKVISVEIPIKVSVEGYQSKLNNSKTIYIDVSGYEELLK